MLVKAEFDPRLYRDAMARFAGAVHVVTTDGPAGRRGSTVIAACSVSDNPPTVLVCLNRGSVGNDLFVSNGCFALNTLADGQRDVAGAFSGLGGIAPEDRFGVGKWSAGVTGSPVLDGAAALFDCEIVEAKDFATHRILFGAVRATRVGDSRAPLIYYDRAYRGLADPQENAT